MASLLTPDNPVVVRGWSLWVPPPLTRDGKPKWINLNERSHWGGKSGKTHLWRDLAGGIAAQAPIPRLDHGWVQCLFSFGDNRRRDVNNYQPTSKACIDGLTDAGIWADDRDGIVTGPDNRRRERGGGLVGVEIRIFEVGQ